MGDEFDSLGDVADCLIHFAGMECHAFMAADLADRSPEAVAEALLSESDRRMGTEIHAVKPHGGSRETGVQRGACGWTLEAEIGHGAGVARGEIGRLPSTFIWGYLLGYLVRPEDLTLLSHNELRVCQWWTAPRSC